MIESMFGVQISGVTAPLSAALCFWFSQQMDTSVLCVPFILTASSHTQSSQETVQPGKASVKSLFFCACLVSVSKCNIKRRNKITSQQGVLLQSRIYTTECVSGVTNTPTDTNRHIFTNI